MMRYLILDLETVAIDNAADFIRTDDIEPPSNYVKQEAKDSYVAKEKAKRLNAAALDIDLARVCVLGVIDTAISTEASVVTMPDEATERDEAFSYVAEAVEDRLNRATIITFNGHHYDLPLLMRRARYLGVDFPRLNLDRYRSPHIDLYEELSMRGALKGTHGLRWYMRRLGMTDLLESDPLERGGGDVAQAVADGRWDDIAAHCRADVLGTYQLASWMGVL